uniref:Uncharacterized protein n=1 Tax=Setaria digitata TaxID=48799 RepID=A0A915PC65_9BILA
MKCDRMSNKFRFRTSVALLHAERILDAQRQNSDSILGVRVSGMEMFNIYKAFHGRLNTSYWRRDDGEKVSSSLNLESFFTILLPA